jgi:flagellar protein FlgJ
MTAPLKETQIYGDFAGLAALKKGAREDDPNAIRQVARQFESLFARMMIKSMRDAIGKDPIFGSDQSQMYQGMFDDQLSMEMTKGRGLGLADMLVRQLQHRDATQAHASGTPPAASTAEQQSFIRETWPQAQQAAQQLGVHPVSLLAQAALESHWGRSVPQDAAGNSSNNLFGIKAGATWNGPSVASATQEYQNGAAVSTSAAFRAYGSSAQSFQDYVAVLRANPRYSGAVGSGNDVRAFAMALQRGGYATDPDYAHKLTAVAAQVRAAIAGGEAPKASTLATHESPLKFASAAPIVSDAGSL